MLWILCSRNVHDIIHAVLQMVSQRIFCMTCIFVFSLIACKRKLNRNDKLRISCTCLNVFVAIVGYCKMSYVLLHPFSLFPLFVSLPFLRVSFHFVCFCFSLSNLVFSPPSLFIRFSCSEKRGIFETARAMLRHAYSSCKLLL